MGFERGDLVVTKLSYTYPEGYPVYKVPAGPEHRKAESAGRVLPGTIGFVTKVDIVYADVLFFNGIYCAILMHNLKKVER